MTILIIIEVILAILLVVLVLLQTSDNEGLGLGGGSGLGGLMTARGTASFLTRATSIVATLFMIMSIILTIAASSNSEKKILKSLPSIENINESEETITIDEPSIPDTN